jgi:hypothetical protein
MKKNNSMHNNFADALGNREIVTAKTPCIRLNGTLCASKAFMDFVAISESLVAFNVKTGKIVRFIDAFIPGANRNECGTRFKISGNGAPMYAAPTPAKQAFQYAYFDWFKLPADTDVEFKLLRIYAAGVRARAKIQVIDLNIPHTGELMRSPKTMRDRITINECGDLFAMRKTKEKSGKETHAWHDAILEELSAFSGLRLYNSLGGRAAVTELATAGSISKDTLSSILEDTKTQEEEEEVQIESMADTISIPQAAEEEEEYGYIPDNPLLRNEKQEEEEEVELLD